MEEVLNHYSDHTQASATLSLYIASVSNKVGGKRLKLTQTEKQDIITFLHMLTDSTFITDTRFSDPHLRWQD